MSESERGKPKVIFGGQPRRRAMFAAGCATSAPLLFMLSMSVATSQPAYHDGGALPVVGVGWDTESPLLLVQNNREPLPPVELESYRLPESDDEVALDTEPIVDPVVGEPVYDIDSPDLDFVVDDADIVEEEPATAQNDRVPAGSGFLSFYEFGAVPTYLNGIGFLQMPLALNPTPGTGFIPRRLGPVRWGASVSAGVAYTDNVFGSSDNPEGDVIWSITPSIYLETGNRGTARLLYSPSYQQYTRYSSETRVDQTLLFSVDYPFEKLRVGGTLAYITRSGLFAESDEIGDLDTYAGSLYASYPLTHRLSTQAVYAFSLQDADPGDLQFDNSLTLSLDYQVTSRIGVGVWVRPGYFTSEDVSQSYIAAGLSGSYQASTRLRTFASLGVEARDLSNSEGIADSLVTPILEAGAIWTPRDYLSFNARVFRNVVNNPFNSSEANVQTGGSLGATIIFWRKLTLSGFVSVAYAEEYANEGGIDEEYVWFLSGASLSYPITRSLSASAFYSFTARSAIEGTTGFQRNIAGIGLTWTF